MIRYAATTSEIINDSGRASEAARVRPAREIASFSANLFPGRIIDLIDVAPSHLTDAPPAASLDKRVVRHIPTKDVAEDVVLIGAAAIAHGLHHPDFGKL